MKKTLACLALLGALLGSAAAQAPRVPVLFDTDIGNSDDTGDAFALALILASPELELRGITTVGAPAQTRAMLVCRFLTVTGRRHTAVATGGGDQPARELGRQYQYYYHPDVLFNRTKKPEQASAVDFLAARLKAQPGKLTLLATGPLTNVAHLLAEKPESKSTIKRIILTGGTLGADVKAARAVLDSGMPLVIVPTEITEGLKLGPDELKRVFDPGTALSLQIQALYQLQDDNTVPLIEVLAAALCFEEQLCTLADLRVDVDDKGKLRTVTGKPNARVATAVKKEEFVRWYVGRMASCLPPARTPARTVERGGMPHRVHVAEDFDTDIERRWWMSGKPETKIILPGSPRACRGVLTHDFDDLLGNPKAMYTAVIFNPVPGPPMGKNTRLGFRYWLKGTDTLRVQIYSLTNGYHRHLVLNGLPQGKWQEATVDMTVARRPDGTGGPLSEGERIDDIQFYADPKAELLIDEIVLYDAAGADEKRPFPRKVHFTGWFDSGKQGKEWPGAFDIVADRGYYWHAARSVPNADGVPWVRLHLRGLRPLGASTALSFRYRLTGATSLYVNLTGEGAGRGVDLRGLTEGRWAQATVDFAYAAGGGPRKGDLANKVDFVLPKGAELLLDDVLLFEPRD